LATNNLVNSTWYQRATDLRLHHLLFWVVYFVFWVIFYRTESTLGSAVLNSFVLISFHGFASYLNIYILFEQLFRTKMYLSYILSIVLTVLLAGVLWMLVMYAINSKNGVDTSEFWKLKYVTVNVISITYTIAITMSLKMVKQWYERERLTQNLERINMETELKYLKSQINPHFLFNSLNSLYALTLKKSDKAPELVLKLSDILRYVLYEGGERWVSLEKEINYLKSYLDLEKLRNGDRLVVNFDIQGNVSGQQVAPMIFLTFLENSFKHGINQKADGGVVSISMKIEEDTLNFSIVNSKPKKQRQRNKTEAGGIGLVNIQKRLTLLYPEKHKLTILDDVDDYRVSLRLNL
jgi:two-component system LytT family sensor kinase